MIRFEKILTLEDPAAELLVKTSETGLYRYNEPMPGFFAAESPNVIIRGLEAGYEPVSVLMAERKTAGAEARDTMRMLELLDMLSSEIPVFETPLSVMQTMTGFPMTRGAVCLMKRRTLPDVNDVLKDASRIAVLENVVNPTNIGVVFRSAAAMNLDALLLTPGCCDPLYRRSLRVSMGTVFQIPWTFIGSRSFEWPEKGVSVLRKLDFTLAAMALSDDSISIADPALKKAPKLALILGSEGPGLMQKTIDACDYTVRIPMRNGVDSLNVAAAGAVAFWEIGRKA